MSHITTAQTKIDDLDSLKAACDALGFEFMEGQKTYRWYGRYMGDYPMPAHMTREDLGKCDHAIRVPGAVYEVGLARTPDGRRWELRYDFYDRKLYTRIGGERAGRLVREYALHRAKAEARRLGHRVVGEKRMEDGSIRLQLQGR